MAVGAEVNGKLVRQKPTEPVVAAPKAEAPKAEDNESDSAGELIVTVEIASPVETSSPLVFTDAAASKVKSLIEEENNDALMLRVFVTGGGCSGFQYGFTFDENEGDGDTAVENGGVKLLIDPM
ncbi:unnamed protein product, partial [Cyprideis torosa]